MQQETGHKLPAISLLKDAKLLNRDHTFVRPHSFLSFPFPRLFKLHRSFSSARLESHMAVNNCSSCDAMDKLWFYQNVLFFQPDVVVSLQSKLTRPKSISPAKLPDISSHQCSKIQSSDESTNRQSTYKDERPAKLNIVIGQPISQLQPLLRSTKIRSHSSSPSKSKRRPRVKSYRSLSELENYELKGFMDLGFTFPKDKLNPHMMRMVPGLQRLGEKDGEQEGNMRQVRRPYLSEAWLVDSPGSPLINLRVLPKTPDGADMKKHLKFWAQRVAMLVHDEP